MKNTLQVCKWTVNDPVRKFGELLVYSDTIRTKAMTVMLKWLEQLQSMNWYHR